MNVPLMLPGRSRARQGVSPPCPARLRYSNPMRFLLFVLLALLALTVGVAAQVVQHGEGIPLNQQLIRPAADSRLVPAELAERIKEQIAAPPPLRGRLDRAAGQLPVSDILSET